MSSTRIGPTPTRVRRSARHSKKKKKRRRRKTKRRRKIKKKKRRLTPDSRMEQSERPEQLESFTAAVPDIESANGGAAAHIAQTESRSLFHMIDEARDVRGILPDVVKNRAVDRSTNRHPILGLEQQDIAVAKAVVLIRAQCVPGAVGADGVGPERVQSASAAERVLEIEGNDRARIGRRHQTVHGETLTRTKSVKALLHFGFDPMKVEQARVVVAHLFDRELRSTLIAVISAAGLIEIGAYRVGKFRESTVALKERRRIQPRHARGAESSLNLRHILRRSSPKLRL